ncbi:MAG: hypothetical protein IJT27_04120, partial [Clostridia bacterium]|nr:hypothetical protein [Clostridia bacterium]
RGTVTEQEGAVYDLATNTLTLTDFNKGNYKLRINLMGDDFTLCVKGTCRLSRIEVAGGGVMQPKWGDNLRITGDGTLSVNPNKTFESGVYFNSQEEEKTVFIVDPQVNFTVSGSRTAIEVYAATGTFTMKSGDKEIAITKKEAVRNLGVSLEGYSNPGTKQICRCRNAADPEGIYHLVEGVYGDGHSEFFVERYFYVAKHDLYLEDYQWGIEHSGDGSTEVKFNTMEEANAAGFSWILDDEGNEQWMAVNGMGNYGSEDVYQDAAGNRYIKDYTYGEQGRQDIVLTIEPLEEAPGKYLFLYTPDVDPETLTEVREDRVIEGMFDYEFPKAELTLEAAPAFVRGDVDGDGSVTASDARYALRAAVGLNDTAEGLDFSDPNNRCYLAADVDGIAGISAGDARLILRAAVGLEDLEA